MKKKIVKFAGGLFEFTKILTIAVTIIFIYVLVRILNMAELSVKNEFTGSLPYLSAVASAVSIAYGAIIAAVTDKSKKENLNKHTGAECAPDEIETGGEG